MASYSQLVVYIYSMFFSNVNLLPLFFLDATHHESYSTCLYLYNNPILQNTAEITLSHWIIVTRPCLGAAWNQKPVLASGDSLAEATMGQSPFFVRLPSLIKLSRGVIGF